MAPSWGTRFSAMSILARILNRETIMTNWRFDGGGSSWRTPSTRRRILQASSNGSRWMSLAPARIACSRIWLTIRMIRPLRPGGGGWSRSRTPLVVVGLLLAVLVGLLELAAAGEDRLARALGAEERLDQPLDDRERRDHRADGQPGQELDLVEDEHLVRGDEGDVEASRRGSATGAMSWSRQSFSGSSRASAGSTLRRRRAGRRGGRPGIRRRPRRSGGRWRVPSRIRVRSGISSLAGGSSRRRRACWGRAALASGASGRSAAGSRSWCR